VTLGLEWQLVVELLLLGAFAGFLAGLLGVGGGMLMVPFMTFVLTSKGMPAATSSRWRSRPRSRRSASRRCLRCDAPPARRRAWDVVMLLAPGIIAGSLIGASSRRRCRRRFLAWLFAAFIGFSAPRC
jgi:uncharacterized membrane protein YfcA